MSEPTHHAPRIGFISLFVRHPTAANLLMIAMVAMGLIGAIRLNVQFFPTIQVPVIFVEVAWPGASAADVESRILDALEPELRFLDGVTATSGMAREGSALITLEFDAETDMQKALADAEQAVSGVTILPIDAEPPQVRRVTFYEPVSKIAITGPFSEKVLKHYARQIRDGLLDAGIDQVELVGMREEEISILVPDEVQRELNLSVGDIADTVSQGVQNIPAGTVEGAREIQLRSMASRQTPEEIGQIEVRALANGERISVDDIATIETRFDREAPIGQISGQPAVELRVKRAVTADTLETTAIVDDYIHQIRAELPPTLEVYQYDTTGRFVLQRLSILVENGVTGLLLVLVALAIFLDLRIAFWVAAGIPVSIFGTLGLMWLTGQSLNMVSIFSLIMMIGIIVDDAIVVGEHTATLEEAGHPPIAAAIGGASSMLKPVMAATLTTMAAFVPIFAVTGPIGQVMHVIPMVVLAVLLASTFECFMVLPAHLNKSKSRKARRPNVLRRGFDRVFVAFRDGAFRRILEAVVDWRYTFLAVLLGMLIVLAGLLAGDRIRFHFFLAPEAEVVRASVVFAPGVPVPEQRVALETIEGALREVERDLLAGSDEDKLVNATFTTIGAYEIFERIRLQNVAQIEVEVTASETRSVPTSTIVERWGEAIPPIAGVLEVAVSPVEQGLPNRAIEVELKGAPIEVLKAAAEDLADTLATYGGVNGILDNLPYGKQELVMELTDTGRALGFTMEIVGRQVRNLVEGAVADRFARDDEEVTIKVMRDNRAGRPDLDNLMVQSPRGEWVPLGEVLRFNEVDSFAIILHAEGQRTVLVSADVDTRVTSSSNVLEDLKREALPALAADYGVSYQISGQESEREQSFEDFLFGLILAAVFIYVILALIFESYIRPFFVMVMIPFGAMGALFGHLLLGMDLTVVSLVGFLGLTGVLVNDSIILIDRVAQRLAMGESVRVAAVAASQDRLRAILLTSITTILGLLPLLFETSRQAQFLIPLAVTFIFGLLMATVIVPLLIPVLFQIGADLRGAARRVTRRPAAQSS
ncbi:efflux RND transporter permease subunit [Acuticoccus sp. M5D2P5]|uniref:efflux RND transporter permease subunit n=1 Tax=Acuticoccus kalidii TaxID=2910977 RepID=UPI001F21877B|nr:efflux RND transporter permease subunit [Acuticoccus kalidii]MCF3933892.1 efflux RND transporter permease subunit [Acuticoccus kalidii]